MLSNPASTLHARQRQHRRQNSTPTAFEGVKIASNLPKVQQQRRQQVSHRRGMSLDRRIPPPSPGMQQDFATVSKAAHAPANTASAITPHPVLREAHQQRIARPDPLASFSSLAEDEHYLISPHATPHSQRFDSSCFDALPVPFELYDSDINVSAKITENSFAENISKEFELFSDSGLSTPTFVTFQDASIDVHSWMSEGDSAISRRSSRRISNGIMDRVAKFESLGIDASQRPLTPPTQNDQVYLPPSQPETSQEGAERYKAAPSRFDDGYDESMEETIKPNRATRAHKAQDIFADLPPCSDRSTDVSGLSSTLPPATTFTTATNPAIGCSGFEAINASLIKPEPDFEVDSFGPSAAMRYHISNANNPSQFTGPLSSKPDLGSHDEQSLSDTASRRGSPHRRTESLASIASAASIAGINIEETKTETGVTIEDIAAFIEGPDPVDNKWLCLYENCGKRFGRKENIKSHVQTHLNDRQYQCPTCKKCFVRQHDLKRHAKIHTGIKPYPCECGNSFARHDALTRHRQRGMCIGAFDGIVRKAVKRGRPRKNRPDMDSRLDKSARTRSRNQSTSSVSSQSGYSDSSTVNSPRDEMEMLDGSPFDEAIDISARSTISQSMQDFPLLPSIDRSHTSNAPSPSGVSTASYSSVIPPQPLSLGSIDHGAMPSHPGSPAKSNSSLYNTPPELSRSSSPSACRGTSMYAMDPTQTTGPPHDAALSVPTSVAGLEDQVLLPAWSEGTDGTLIPLDREPSILMLSKFDEEYENAVNMFTEGGDVFFGPN